MNETMKRGIQRRGDMLGHDYVAVNVGRDTDDPFFGPFQEMMNEKLWGEIWSRDAADPKLKSLVSIVVLAMRGQEAELKRHIGGALENGMTVIELREVLIHLVAYGGWPPAVMGFAAAREVFAERDIDPGTAMGER